MEPITDRLVLDIGNSRTKAGLFRGQRLSRHAAFANGDVAAVRAMAAPGMVETVVVGSVARTDAAFLTVLASIAQVRTITGDSPSHVRQRYEPPSALGADRWANVTGASLLFPGRAVLVVALGTCVTYDLVDANGTYLGGIISPGFRMRARAMGEFTARLPVVAPPEEPLHLGLSTQECLAAGVHHGLRSELLSTIAGIRQQHGDVAVVLTGGDAPRFARALENGIFAHPFLTLFGLYALSLHDRPAPGALPTR